jgi:hypothetical protein
LKHDGNLLASASEDCSVRLWDLRTHRAVQGCTGAFRDAVNVVRFNRHDPNSLLCSSERSLFEIDLRQGMIIREAQELTQMEDDISSFDVHPKQAGIVAVADDSGVAKVVDIAAKRVTKHLHHVHSNICSSVAFRPNAQWELITGGMDGILCHWDWSRCKVLATIDMATIHHNVADSVAETQSQSLNPPLIHMAVFLDARYVACVTAAGTLVLQRWRSTDEYKIIQAHRGMATVLRPVASQSMCVTAGVDNDIGLWRLKETKVSPKMTNAELENVRRISHSDKVNDVVCVPSADAVSTVIVAGVANDITLYSLQ